MKPLLRLGLLSLGFLLTGCTTNQQTQFSAHLNNMLSSVKEARWYRHSQLIEPSGRKACAYMQFQGFKKVVILGDFNVEVVKTKHCDDPIRIVGDRAFIPHIQARVVKDTLYIRFDPDFDYAIKCPVVLQIPYQNLNGLAYRGVGNLVVNHLNSRCFDLNLQGNVNAWIKGNMVLTDLNYRGNGRVVLYWVNTNSLNINASQKASILIAGVANNIEINATDNAVVDAKYLRAKTAHIHTTKYAKAEVAVLNNLNALAENDSNIYYYERPVFQGIYMHESGAVLDMHGVYPPYPKELH